MRADISSKVCCLSSGWRKWPLPGQRGDAALQVPEQGNPAQAGDGLDAPVAFHVGEGQGWRHSHAALQPQLQDLADPHRLHLGLVQRGRHGPQARPRNLAGKWSGLDGQLYLGHQT